MISGPRALQTSLPLSLLIVAVGSQSAKLRDDRTALGRPQYASSHSPDHLSGVQDWSHEPPRKEDQVRE